MLFFCGMALVAQAQSLDWDTCVTLAGEGHPDLISAEQTVAEARADVTSAKSDQRPTLTATGSLEKSFTGDKNRSSSVGVSASQLLWDGGATRNVVNSARATLDSSQAALKLAKADTRYNLRVAYLGLWQHQEMVKVLEDIAKLRETNYRMTSLRYEGGTEHKGSKLQSGAKLAQAQAQLAQEKRSEYALELALSRAMGLTQAQNFTITETPVALANIPTKGELEALANQHPTVLKADAAVRAASADLKSASANYSPKLTASATAGKSDDKDFTPSQNAASVGLDLSWTLFDSGARSSAVQKARAVLVSAEAQAAQARRTIVLNLEEAWNTYKAALEDDDVAQQSLAATNERNRISKAQYEVGLITYDTWTVIEDEYVSAQKEAISAHKTALEAEAAWMDAQGEIYGEN
jgi:outer membrane protein TolC